VSSLLQASVSNFVGQSLNLTGILYFIFFASLIFTYGYIRMARVMGPCAVPNHRSLHQKITPKGGGIVIAVVMLLGMLTLHMNHYINLDKFLMFYGIGIVVAIWGFSDDCLDINAKYRLAIQLAIALTVCMAFGGLPVLPLGFASVHLFWAGYLIAVPAFVWFYNLNNFIDGIDGMAISAAIYCSLAASFILHFAHADQLAVLLLMLAVASTGFLVFNWPKAKLFLGESGSAYISYFFSVIILLSLHTSDITIWVWLIIFGYYVADTTATNLTRALTLPKWYLPHRSHAYQNLARCWNSHLKMLLLVLTIDTLWLFPLALLAFYNPGYAWLFAVVAYCPLLVFVVKFGPLFSNE